MDTSAFDQAACQIPLYREVLLQVPASVKDQAYDIRLCGGQPAFVSGGAQPVRCHRYSPADRGDPSLRQPGQLFHDRLLGAFGIYQSGGFQNL